MLCLNCQQLLLSKSVKLQQLHWHFNKTYNRTNTHEAIFQTIWKGYFVLSAQLYTHEYNNNSAPKLPSSLIISHLHISCTKCNVIWDQPMNTLIPVNTQTSYSFIENNCWWLYARRLNTTTVHLVPQKLVLCLQQRILSAQFINIGSWWINVVDACTQWPVCCV